MQEYSVPDREYDPDVFEECVAENLYLCENYPKDSKDYESISMKNCDPREMDEGCKYYAKFKKFRAMAMMMS